jgi:putative membrane protein
MSWLAPALVVLVALEHVWILVLEMFLWRGPVGRRVFGLDPEFAERSAALAMNQGLYNGFLAAGLLYCLLRGEASMVAFLLGCVVVAGIFGGLTAKRSILVVQGLPALVALIVFLLR